jgi:NAD-dependent dihydropyrimidine dehydrogenase PreA subunit
MSLDERYKQVAETISARGASDTLVDIMKELVTEDQIDLILAFKGKRSQSLDQLKESSGLSEEVILEQTSALAKKGIIFNQPNSKGVLVFRLLPLANVGIFEYTFMKKLTYTEQEKRLAGLFTKLFSTWRDNPQITPEFLAQLIPKIPPPDRTIPIRINKATQKSTVIEINQDLTPEVADRILLTQDVKNLIEKFDEIAVGYCFCRQHRDTEGRSCKQTDLRETCFTFGKSARFTTENGFMRMIDKKEALEILLKAEEDGLVHKAYHPNFDINMTETSVCNCCKDCCGNSFRMVVNVSSFLSKVDPDLCTGCETCAELCHTNAIKLGDENISQVDEERCIGCGVCAHVCPSNAIRLNETPPRTVRVVQTRTN